MNSSIFNESQMLVGKNLCNSSQMLIGRGLDNGCVIVDTTLYHYNFYGIIIDYHYPISLNSYLSAIFVIGLIILIKKYKLAKEKEEKEE